MKLFEYDYRDTQPSYGAIQLQDLLQYHLKRVRFETSIGTIVLQFLPWRSYVTTTRFLEEDATYVKLREEALILADVGPENKDLYAHKLDIGKNLSKYIDNYSLGCFVDPVLSTTDELDAIYHGLDKAERLTLENLLMTLTQDVPLEEVDFTVQKIAQSYGVNLIDPKLFENPAKVQISVLADHLQKEREVLENDLHR